MHKHSDGFTESLTLAQVACLTAAKIALQEYQSANCHQLARNLWQVVAHVIGASVSAKATIFRVRRAY